MKKNFLFLGLGFLLALGTFFFQDQLGSLKTSVIGERVDFVTLETNLGDIKIKLLEEDAPHIAKNFVNLAKNGFYDETIFHRVIDGFMIQGGDFENFNGTGGHAYEGGLLKDEISERLSHVRGTVSMANRGPNTNGSQFFIVQSDSTFLDGSYSIFGQVSEGMDVVDKITKVRTDLNDAPLQRVVIQKVTLE